MKLLREASNQTAYLKAGLFGFNGSGKTFTATKLAIGLAQLAGKTTVAYFDTETGSDFVTPHVRAAGLTPFVFKGRAFVDVLKVLKEAEQEGVGAVIVDSVSHLWRDLMNSYKVKLNRRNGLYFQDWDAVKTEWQQFSDLYVNSSLHVILCGRAGYEYENEKNEETGRTDLIKVGTKMKVEGEMGYEPSLLIEMERVKKSEGSGWINRAVILKDRTDTMNGKEIDFPEFKDFTPIINFLNIGGEHVGVDTSRNSEELFTSDRSITERRRRHAIALEEIQEILLLNGLSGTSQDVKKQRADLLISIFGTSGSTAIENLHLDKLLEGVAALRAKFAPEAVQPSEQSEAVGIEPPATADVF